MKVTIASLFLTITSLAAAQWGGESCSEAGRVTCSPSNGQRYPHIMVCVNRGSGLKWEIQATCPNGQSCHYSTNNWAWCEPY